MSVEAPPTADRPRSEEQAPPEKTSLLARMGPGLITGAADDDPSGIATYSQAGARFGYDLLWTMILTYPLMCAIQLVAARIGRVTGKGLAANLLEILPQSAVVVLALLLFVANTINIGADVAAMGAAAQLLAGGVIVDRVAVRADVATGTALIVVTPDGENSIVVGAGANATLTDDEVATACAGAAVVLAQTEVGAGPVDAAARSVAATGGRLVLSPAPVVPLAEETLALADPLVVNQEEAAEICGHPDATAVLRRTGARSVVPVRDPSVAEVPLMDFDAGYVQRVIHTLPRQGAVAPWQLKQNYLHDARTLRRGRIDDGVLTFR